MLIPLIETALLRDAAPEDLLDALRGHAEGAGEDDLRDLAERVHSYIASLPGALRELSAAASRPGGRAAAFAAGQVLVYLLDEDDLLPESAFGVLGLIDDAYLAHTAVAMLRAPGAGTPAEGAYAPPDASTTALVRSLLPPGVPESLERTCDSLVRVATALFATPGPAAGDAERQLPQLRVRRAVASLRGA